MGMQVDEARREHEPAGIDLLATGTDRQVVRDGHDPAAIDAEVTDRGGGHRCRRDAWRCG